VEESRVMWARRFATGLLGKARAALRRLGPKGEYPSRGYTETVDEETGCVTRTALDGSWSITFGGRIVWSADNDPEDWS
jgi:hypothetical protein